MDLTELVDLAVLPLRVTARAVEPVHLPANAGSSLRGAFGSALKGLVCVRPDLPECAPCPHRESCAYPQIFEPQARAGEPGTRGFEDLPRPCVVRPEERPGRPGAPLPEGAALSWRMTLIGRAVEQLPYFALAWRAMGERGMGTGRGRFTLERVEGLDPNDRPVEILFDRASGLLRTPQGVRSAECGSAEVRKSGSAGAIDSCQLTIVNCQFQTPTLLKYEGRPAARPEFHILWRNLQRRLSMLRLAHGAGRPAVDFAGAIRRAEEVRLADWSARDLAWERYSRRQGQRIPMRGFVGTARYEGDLVQRSGKTG